MKQKNIWTYWPALLALFTGALIAIWIIIIPYNKTPDEYYHFSLAYFMAVHHTIPLVNDPELVKLMDNYAKYYGALPPLPYMFMSLGIAIGALFTSFNKLYIMARIMSLICGFGTVLLSYLIVNRLWPRSTFMKIGVPLTVLLTPQASFIFSYANNDVLTTFVVTLCYYFMIRILKEGWTTKLALYLGGTAGLVLLCKPNGYIAGLLIGVFLLLTCFNNLKKLLKNTLLMALGTVLVSGWWFVRNYLIYNGDFLGIKTSQLTTAPNYHDKGYSFIQFLQKTPFIKWLFQSTFATFDWMMIRLPNWYYTIIIVITCLSILGVLIQLIRNTINKKGKFAKDRLVINTIFIMAIGFAISLVTWTSYTNDFQPQGKYLFTAFVPFAIILTYGLESIGNIFSKGKYLILTAYCGFLVYANVLSIITLYNYYFHL